MSGMTREDRAKQFMPFSPLKGLEEALSRMEKQVCPRIILGEDAQMELDMALRGLCPGNKVCITYYSKDEYISRTGQVSGIDINRRLIFLSGIPVAIDDIICIDDAQ